MVKQLPSFDAFNDTIDRLLQTLRYLKLNEFILKKIMKILETIWNIIQYLIGKAPKGSQAPVGTKVVLGLIVVVILVITVFFIVLFIIRKKRRKKVKTILGEKITKDSSVLSFLERSKTLEAEGQYRQAIRLHFIAMLFHLHQNHILYHDHTMTGLEMINKLKKDGFRPIDSFEGLVNKFNAAWYGMEEIRIEQFESWQVQEATFWQEVVK